MADVFCTFIATAAQRDAAIAAAEVVPGGHGMFTMPLCSLDGGPVTHYASSGFVRPAIRDALVGLCTIVEEDQDTHAVLAANGLKLASV